MSVFLRGACALLAAVGLAIPATGAEDTDALQAAFGVASPIVEEASGVEPISYESMACGPECGPVCDLDCGPGSKLPCGQFFFGAEYLNVRANFSEATAYRVLDTVAALETLVQYNFDYGDSYRLYGGYRLCECGCDITFTYTNFDSTGAFAPITNDNPDLVITPAFEAVIPGTTDTLSGTARVSVDSYDIGFSKTIPLGCPLVCGVPCGGCGDCNECGDACGGTWCPAWDITWSGGIRFASVDSALEALADRATAPDATTLRTVNFDGAGLRFGVMGRRYFGRRGLVSAFVRGDISLLLGEVDHQVSTTPGVTTTRISSTQVVPVTEIEAGLSANLMSNVTLSGGYLLSVWHDLGHRAEYDYIGQPGTATTVTSMDDANLMTFDGFFLRAEAAF